MVAGVALVLALFAGLPSVSPIAAPPAICCRQHSGGHSGGHGGGHRGGSRSSGSRVRAPRMRSSAPRVRAPRSSTLRGYHAPKADRAPRSSSPRVKDAPRARSYHAPRSPKTHAPGARDSRGRLERSAAAKDAFKRQTGHPHGWPGHVIDHIVPLACGGADAPTNMQWQTIAAAKAKDRVERRGCQR